MSIIFKMKIKKTAAALFCLFTLTSVYPEKDVGNANIDWNNAAEFSIYDEYKLFKESYPFAKFILGYDRDLEDWTLTVNSYGSSHTFYRCGGLYLPKEELPNKDHYWRVIYSYSKKLTDPADFTEEQKERIRKYSSTQNRKNGAVSSKFIYDAIYDSYTQKSTETHIKDMTLWGKWTRVNENLVDALNRIEAKIYKLAETDSEIQSFIATLSSTGAYNWREIRDSHTKSFHSFGIAIDVLPKGWGKKIVYWGFEKNKGNDDWMFIPLKDRWMPPQAVIDAFEEEGFIWGGRWAIWDNMHFEYHPEIIKGAKMKGTE